MKIERNFGCLGVLWLFGLILGSWSGAAFLNWQNPPWLDRAAFWRGELLIEGKTIPVVYISAVNEDTDRVKTPQPLPPPEIIALEEHSVAKNFTPGKDMALELDTKAKFYFSGDALSTPVKIEATPIVSIPSSLQDPSLYPLGLSYRLRFNGKDHIQFDGDVQVELPLDLSDITGDIDKTKIRVTSYANGQWESYYAVYDPDKGTVRATIPHASIIGTAWAAFTGMSGGALLASTGAVITPFVMTETGRATVQRGKWGVSATMGDINHNVLETENFAIHYSTIGSYAVPDNDHFPLPPTSPDHPAMVSELGRCLEDGLQSLPALGMPYGKGFPNRWSVFLENISPLGDTPAGGPITLDNDYPLRDNDGSATAVKYRLWATCTHEMIHVAQDSYFNIISSRGSKDWIEATAEYISNKHLQQKGIQTEPYIRFYINTAVQGYLPEEPFGQCEGSNNCEYGYAYFFHWLDDQGYNAVDIIKEVNSSHIAMTAISSIDIDNALVKHTGKSLSEIWTEFSADFYHTNLATGQYTPLNGTTGVNNDIRLKFNTKNKSFYQASRATSTELSIFPYAKKTVSLEPLSAHHILFTAGNLPPDDPTKLVVYIPKTPFLIRARAGAYFDAQMWPGAGGNRLVDLPLKSVPPLQDFEHNDKTGGEFFVVPLFSATKDKEGQGANYASIILSKGNTKGGGDVNIRRWLLMPPKGLQWDAADRPDTILVKWEESELKKIAKHKEFVGYNIYRQEIVDGSDNKFTGGPLNEKPITETSYETPALRGRWKYSVTVVDILGNESAFSEPEPDPFAGEWEGALYLVNGDFSYILDEIQREDKEQDAEDRASYARAREFINLVQNFMRLGVPITFRIEKKHEKYAVTPIEFAYFNMEKETDEGILWFEQAGEYTLSSIEKLQDGTPVKLSLKRKDEFDETYSHTYADGTHSLPLTLRIRLKRIEEGSRDPAERERKRKRLVKMFSGWAKRLEK